MAKVYLHIGSAKTGTTSIQKTLLANKRALEGQGICFPTLDVNHHKFYFASQQNRELWPRGFYQQEEPLLQKGVEAFFKQFEADIDKGFPVYIVSTEYLYRSDPFLIENVVDYLYQFFNEVEVVVFLRSPPDIYSSLQQQIVKASYKLNNPVYYRYNMRRVIEAWSAKVKIKVFKYDLSISSFDSLSDYIGINSAGFKVPQRSNESMCVEQMVLLQKIQSGIYQDHDNHFKRHFKILDKLNLAHGCKPTLKPSVASLIEKNHLEDIDWVYETYAIDCSSRTDQVESNMRFSQFPLVEELFEVDPYSVSLYETMLIDEILKRSVGLYRV